MFASYIERRAICECHVSVLSHKLFAWLLTQNLISNVLCLKDEINRLMIGMYNFCQSRGKFQSIVKQCVALSEQ